MPGVDAEVTEVKALQWNSESDLLAVRLGPRGPEPAACPHTVQLWHRENYCWYKKWERRWLVGTAPDGVGCFAWDGEDAYKLVVSQPCADDDGALELDVLSLCWSTTVSRGAAAAVAFTHDCACLRLCVCTRTSL